MTLDEQRLKTLINDHVEPLSPKWLHSNGDNIEIGCRYCGDSKNFSISLKKQIFHCWACDVSGTLYKFFKDHSSTHVLKLYSKLSKHIRKENNINNIFNPLSDITYTKQDIKLPDGLVYIKDAELGNDILYYDFFEFMNSRHIDRDLMYKLSVHFDLKNDSVWFPSYDAVGNLNFAVSRKIYDCKNPYYNLGERRDIIFNEFLIDWGKPIYLFEGIFDSARVYNSIPLFGMFMDESFLIFKKIINSKCPVVFMLDKENKAKSSVVNMSELLRSYVADLPIYIGEIISDHKDVGEMKTINMNNFKFYEYSFSYGLLKNMK